MRGQSSDVEGSPAPRDLPPTSDYSNRMFRWQQPYREPTAVVVPGELTQPRTSNTPDAQSPPTLVRVSWNAAANPVVRSSSQVSESLPFPARVERMPEGPGPNTFRQAPVFVSPQVAALEAPLVSQEEELPGDTVFRNRWYGRAEYLLWWVKGSPLPPLATTEAIDPLTFMPSRNGSYPGNPPGLSPGALSQAGSVVVLGDTRVGRDARSGGRFQFGTWLLEGRSLGVEARAFFLGQQTDRASRTSFGAELLARPVRDAAANWAEASVAHVLPPNRSGTIGYVHDSNLWGAEVDGRLNLVAASGSSLDLVAGYRTVGLYESLTITEFAVLAGTAATGMQPGTPASSEFYVDNFRVKNQFHGGQVGVEGSMLLGRLSLEANARLALGCTVQSLDISGQSNSGPVGILATTSSSGRHQRTVFSVMPELGLTVGYQVTDSMRAYAGYDVLYWSNVLRPGNQIERTITLPMPGGPTPTLGKTRPTTLFHPTDFWAQGIHLGLEFCY